MNHLQCNMLRRVPGIALGNQWRACVRTRSMCTGPTAGSSSESARVQTVPRAAADARRERAARIARNRKPEGANRALNYSLAGTATLGCGIAAFYYFADEESKRKAAKAISSSLIGNAYRWLVVQLEGLAAPFSNPSREKLLPDWPIPGYPPGPCPPTLVLDLEGTLVKSEWHRKYGWRYAKRPGVDEFLTSLAKHYEIVIFTPSPWATAEEVITSLDKYGAVPHRLYRDATMFYKGVHVKDLSKLNRDLRRVIILDDDPAAYQFQPENAIPIKEYTDANDRTDTTLVDLVPFLRALAVEGVDDFREVLKSYEGKSIPEEYKRRRTQAMQHETEQKRKGLGGLLRAFTSRGDEAANE